MHVASDGHPSPHQTTLSTTKTGISDRAAAEANSSRLAQRENADMGAKRTAAEATSPAGLLTTAASGRHQAVAASALADDDQR